MASLMYFSWTIYQSQKCPNRTTHELDQTTDFEEIAIRFFMMRSCLVDHLVIINMF